MKRRSARTNAPSPARGEPLVTSVASAWRSTIFSNSVRGRASLGGEEGRTSRMKRWPKRSRLRSPSVRAPDPHGQLTWVGHSTVVLDLDDVRLVTDPVLTDRVVHLRRHHAAEFDARSGVDSVVISHVHFDHVGGNVLLF